MLEIALQCIYACFSSNFGVMRHTLLVEISSSHVSIEIISPVLPWSSSRHPASHLHAVNMPLFPFYIIYILSLSILPTTLCFFPLLPQLLPASALTAVLFPTFFSVSLSMHVTVCDVSVTYQTNSAKSNLITQIYTIVCHFKGLRTVTAPICLSLDDHYWSSDCGGVPSIGLPHRSVYQLDP